MGWVDEWTSSQPVRSREDPASLNLALARIPQPPPLAPEVVAAPPDTPHRLHQAYPPGSGGSIGSADGMLGGMQIVVDTGFWDRAHEWGELCSQSRQFEQLHLPGVPECRQLHDALQASSVTPSSPRQHTAEQALRLADGGLGRASQGRVDPQQRLAANVWMGLWVRMEFKGLPSLAVKME